MRAAEETPDAYLAALPDDRREAISRVRQTILENLPEGYEESLSWGMLTYEVPLERFPDTYNGKPLGYVALASQKGNMSLHLMGIYGNTDFKNWFEAEAGKRGAKLDIGKACVRFKRLEDLPLDLVGEAVARISVNQFIEMYEKSRS